MSDFCNEGINVSKSIYLNKARILEDETGIPLFVTVSQLFEGPTVERQLIVLSSLSSNIISACSQHQNHVAHYYVELLCQIFLASGSKSPFRQSSSRLLQKFSEEYKPIISTCLAKGLIDIMSLKEASHWNIGLNKISDCFDNFSFGIDGVSLCFNEVLSFICGCLNHVLENISENLTPVQQMEFIVRGHSALRVAVMVLQRFSSNVKRKANSNCATEEKILMDILQVTSKLLNNELIPMDSKGNCGMVIVILSASVVDDGYCMVLNKLCGEEYQSSNQSSILDNISFESEIAQMSICTGLITIAPIEVLCTFNIKSKIYFLEAIFAKLMALSVSTDNALTLGCSRAIQQSIHVLHNAVLKNSFAECFTLLANTKILLLSLEYVWSRLDHYMDCVRHAAKSMLHDLVQMGNYLSCREMIHSDFVEIIIHAVEKIPTYKKSKYIALAVLANELGSQRLMRVFPHLVSTLLIVIEDPSMSAHVCNAFETLMLKNFKEASETDWITTWISPVFEAYSKSKVCYILEGIISKAMKTCPVLLEHTVSLFDRDISNSSHLKVFIVCLKLATKLGILDKKNRKTEDADKWKGIIKYNIIIQALVNQDDEIRLSALSLIVESNKTTQCFTVLELEVVKQFLWYNINSDSPAVKQKNLMLFKKMLTRMRESAYPIVKSINHFKEDGTSIVEKNETLLSYRGFLTWLEEFCFQCFFPGANFCRRASALEILTMLDEMLLLMDETISPETRRAIFSFSWRESHSQLLLQTLKDSFESNKILALKLLIKFPVEVLKLNDTSRVNYLLNVGLTLAASIKPPDCITGAYIFKLLVSHPETEPVLIDNASKISSESYPEFRTIVENEAFYEKRTFCLVWILIADLKMQLAVAKNNLLIAAGRGPLYGTLYSIRTLLKNMDFNCLASDIFWNRIILDLVSLCFELNSTVINVVNNSSPEGHLPMDFEPVLPVSETSESKEISTLQIPPVTAQMVLLCSWRTVKEVSLFMGEVTNQAPIYRENIVSNEEHHLLTKECVLRIGDHFTQLLSETKHRGAFEQAYVGFCLLCKKLWKQPSGLLSQLPRIWLRDTINEIVDGKKSSKLCATRRSAGVPFIVQALVTTELDVSQPTCLKEAMETLLNLLEDKSTVTEELDKSLKTESCTHAMNILRALFRHALLGELVTPYVSRGIMASINGFKGDTWAERNSGTLLFGALTSRIFGVKHSKEDTHRRNRMTGRVFFERFPALYDFLLGELVEASHLQSSDDENISKLHLFPSLFPVLLILSRLYPSSLEGTDTNMQLSAFVPYVQSCLRSKIYKIRELSARAIVPLITANIYIAHLDESFSKISSSISGQNMMHGLLLQISFLLQEVRYPQHENEEMICKKLDNWVNVTQKIINHNEFSFMVKEACIRVLRHLLFISARSLESPFPKKIWNNLFQSIKSEISHLFKPSDGCSSVNVYLGRNTFICRGIQIILEIAVIAGHTSESLVGLLTTLLNEPLPAECISVVLSFICYLFGEVGIECLEEEDGLPSFLWPRNYLLEMNIKNHREILVESNELASTAVKLLSSGTQSYVLQRVLRVIGYLGSSALNVPWHIHNNAYEQLDVINPFSCLVSVCKTEPENVGRDALFCLTSMVQEAIRLGKQELISSEICAEYCNLLMEFSSPEKSHLSRIIVADSLVINHSLFSQEFSFIDAWVQCHLWIILLELLEDQDPDVREAAAKISSKFEFMEEVLKDENDSSPLLKSNIDENDGDGKWGVPDIPITHQLVDVMPQRLEEIILLYFERIHGPRHKYEYAITLLAIALKSGTNEDGEYDANEERVFDKGEANLFIESMNLTRKSLRHVQKVFLDSKIWKVTAPIPSTILTLIGLEEHKASSIIELLNYFKENLLEKMEMCAKVCEEKIDPLLTQGFDSIQLEIFKFGLILDILKEISTDVKEIRENFRQKLECTDFLSTYSVFCS